jgi:hypothetical protein
MNNFFDITSNINIKKSQAGFTLLIAVVTTSLLLLVSFVVGNIAYKQLLLASTAEESQYAFYAADSGLECALYWDLKNVSVSAFDVSTPGAISCAGQNISGGSQIVPTIPTEPSIIGGASDSVFYLQFTKGCAIVRVSKVDDVTTVDSRGYNTCDTSSSRRFERGVNLSYTGTGATEAP